MENKVITLVQLQKALLREDANDKKELEALSQEIKKSANTLEEEQNKHVTDNNNPHGVTKGQVGLGNVENKSSEDIRGELTKENVVNALGYNPPRTDTIYTHPDSAGNKHIPAGGAVDQVLRWKSDGEAVWGDLPDAPNIPDKLPNPKALSFSGGINATYDGSVAVKISLPETPTKLPNPKSLKFTGAVVGEYDGSSELLIEIPKGSDSDQVQGDWSQNDETAPDFIKGRTHYEETVDGKTVIVPLDEKFIPDSIARDGDKLDRFNPSGIGTFSMNRKANTSVGPYSTAMGYSTTASGNASHAEGYQTIAAGTRQHVQGQYNIADSNSKYYHIVGNGKSDSYRSNAHTIDRNGLGWFAGGLKVGGTGQDDETSKEVALKDDIPTIPDKLPNPNVLKFVGAVSGEYDGSSEITIEIPKGGDKQVQGDWSQNDETSPDFIKNRTHWESGLVKGEQLLSEEISVSNSMMEATISSVNIEVGKTYIIIYDNVEYTCEAKEVDEMLVIGNQNLYDGSYEDTGEPFFIDPLFGYLIGTVSGKHILQIFATTFGVHTLDEKFIPDSIARKSDLVGIGTQSDWNQSDDTAVDYIKNKPSIATDDEIVEMLISEDALPAVVDSDGYILSDENGNILLW